MENPREKLIQKSDYFRHKIGIQWQKGVKSMERELRVNMDFYMKVKENETEEDAIARFEKEFSDKEFQAYEYEVREI